MNQNCFRFSLIYLFFALNMLPTLTDAQSNQTLYKNDNQRLAARIEIPLPDSVDKYIESRTNALAGDTSSVRELAIHVRVVNPYCGWTIFGGKSVYLISDAKRIYPEPPFVNPGAGNCGRQKSGDELVFRFPIPELGQDADFQPDNWRLVLESGIYSWETPRETFAIEIYVGDKLFAQSSVDSLNRMVRIDAKAPESYNRFVWTLPDGQTVETNQSRFKQRFAGIAGEAALTGNRNGKPPVSFSIRLDAFAEEAEEEETENNQAPDREDEQAGRQRSRERRSSRLSLTIPVVGQTPTFPPLSKGEKLVGLCFYPAVPDSVRKTSKSDPDADHGAPRLINNRYCHEYIDEFLAGSLGNLAVFWPNVPGPSKTSPDVTEEYVRKLAAANVYSMTIYQRQSPETIKRLTEAGSARFFLYNNLGEYASYLYQGIESATACGIPACNNLLDCQKYFIDRFMAAGAQSYHQTCPFICSTSGSSLSNYELAGGVDFVCSELFAIGAQNLAWAGSEMRGAARKWQPEFWGSWLAHEWQTCDIPFQTEQKYLLLRAALYQQYLMGSSLFILESGSQTTQAGFYTKDSGKRNFGYDDAVPARYRDEMKRFYDFVKESPSFSGGPETDIALVTGNGDSYCGLYLENAPVWGQHEIAKQDRRWKYGDPERSQALVQNLFFPRSQEAIKPYANRFLAGNPFGQVDVVGIDDDSAISDITRYRLLVYAGWNTMTAPVFRVLSRYVENGGTLFLSVPHFSTRTDRESVDYQPMDLWNSGTLAPLIDVQITGKRSLSGPVESNSDWLPSDWLPTEGLQSASGWFVEYQPIFKATEKRVDSVGPVEVLLRQGQTPLLIRQKRGKGCVYTFLGWEYPGKKETADLFKAIISRLAQDCSGANSERPWVEAKPDALPKIAWSVYPHAVYLLNLDANQSVDFLLCDPKGQKTSYSLAPVELLKVPR